MTSLIEVYQNAEKEILGKLKYANLEKRNENLKALKQIREILTDLYPITEKELTKEAKKEYDLGSVETEKLLKDVKPTFNLIDKKTSEFLISNLDDILNPALADVKNVLNSSYRNIEKTLSLVKRELRDELLVKVGEGQVLGTSRKTIARELVWQLEKNGITALTYQNKNNKDINLSLTAYIDGLTRSTLINSKVSAVIDRALQAGHDLLKISTHSKPSPMCKFWQGKIVSITGQNKEYPLLSDALFNGNYKKGGILHRFCRHSLTVYIQTNIKFEN